MRLHEPAAFCAALLNAQPMGFWSPATIVADSRRHGVGVRGPALNASSALATLEVCPSSIGGLAVRVGLGSVRTLGSEIAERIARGRPYTDMGDVVRRIGLTQAQIEALATAGAFGCFAAPTPPPAAAAAAAHRSLSRRGGLLAGRGVAPTGAHPVPATWGGVQSP